MSNIENEPVLGTVIISEERLYALERAALWAQCLDDAGVDNWSGVDYAMEEFIKVYPS